MHKQINLEKLTYYGLFLAVAFLPIKTSISNLGILILLTLSVVSLFANNGNFKVLKKPLFILTSTITLLIPFLIGSLYSPNLQDALFQLNKCIFYLLMPTLLLRTDLSKDKLIHWSITGLIIGSVVSMLFLLSISTYHFFSSNSPILKLFSYDFVGKKFVEPLKEMHPIYLGSYYLFMLVLLWKTKYPLKKPIKIALTVVCTISLIFLNSRSILFIGITLLVVSLFTRPSIKFVLIALSSIFLFILVAQSFLQDTYVYKKAVKGTQWELSNNVAQKNIDSKRTADSRMSRWVVSLDLIRKKPLFGYGTGSARDVLAKEYQKRNMQASLKANYDSHNQYLGYGIQFGLLGLSFLILYLIRTFYISIRTKDFVLFSYVLIVAGLCLTENYLIRNMGINFVALFGAILIVKSTKNA